MCLSNVIYPVHFSSFFLNTRVQLFHCLKHDGTGGRTLLEDGFNAAENVRKQSPDNFDLLTKVPIKHEYIENVGECHNHMIGIGPVLNAYPWNNELYLIRQATFFNLSIIFEGINRQPKHIPRGVNAIDRVGELRLCYSSVFFRLVTGIILHSYGYINLIGTAVDGAKIS